MKCVKMSVKVGDSRLQALEKGGHMTALGSAPLKGDVEDTGFCQTNHSGVDQV